MSTISYHDCPSIEKYVNEMCYGRCIEILDFFRNNDNDYSTIIKNIAKEGEDLKNVCAKSSIELDNYMNLINEQKIYELDIVYKHAFYDAFSLFKKSKLFIKS